MDAVTNLRIHLTQLTTGINQTPEFKRKGLATHAVNVGTKCGHDCLYCSTGALLRMHPSFKRSGESPFGHGYAIVDPSTPERVAKAAKRIKIDGTVQLCTTVDAWAPEAQEHQLGRRCLAAILENSQLQVRVLTKNAAVAKDFDLIEQYRGRVLVGLSITGTLDKSEAIKVIEPNASSIQERMAALREAHARGLRTYGMLCPLLPGIADAPDQIDRLVQFAVGCGCEEIFVEPVNPRGAGLRLCQKALEQHGFRAEALAIGRIRKREEWSAYVTELIASIQRSVRHFFQISKLRFLLYPSNLLPKHVEQIRKDDAGVVWLGKD